MTKVTMGLLLGLVPWLGACSTLQFWQSDTPATAPKEQPAEAASALSEHHVKSGSIPELELKHARLWARVDELEEKITRQRERIRVLEKGLMLGIMPDELKGEGEEESEHKGKPKPGKNHKPAPAPAAVSDATEPVGDGAHLDAAAGEPTEDPEGAAPAEKSAEGAAYQKRLAQAHDQYRAGRYGKAVVEFSALGTEFGDKIEGGVHKFWIARSWAALKEYQTARQHFQEFLKTYPKSPWAPRATLELARVENRLGFKETALQRLREVIQQYPNEDAAEMAKMELTNMQKAL